MSNVNQCFPPSAAERIKLSLAGLGEQKITFQKNGNSAHVHEKVLETFPSLVNGGRYEIMRTSDGNSKTLIDVPSPSMGYDVNCLKSALGQAKGYLRPLQKDIKLDCTERTQVLYTSAILSNISVHNYVLYNKVCSKLRGTSTLNLACNKIRTHFGAWVQCKI